MGSQAIRNINIFLASPGGVTAERNGIESIVGSINSSIAAKNQVAFIVRRWEQLVGVVGNPQAQINSWVDDSDIFIGIIDRRWGSDTGNSYDSGFYEEYCRAFSRWEKTGKPQITLFFKEIEQDFLRDPGEQLKKVLDFQNSIMENHTVFFNRYNSVDNLKTLVFQFLVEETFTFPTNRITGNDNSGSANVEITNQLKAGIDPISTEVADVLSAFAKFMGGQGVPSNLDIDRLELFALSISRDNDQMPTHLVNRIFKRRNEITLSPSETRAWFLAYLADVGRSSGAEEQVIPFVSIIGAVKLKKLTQDVAKRCLLSDNTFLTSGWLKVATVLQVRPKSLWFVPPLDDNQELRFREIWTEASSSGELVVRYWLSVRRTRDIRLAHVLEDSSNDSLSTLGSVLVGLLRQKPNATAVAQKMPKLLNDKAIENIFLDQGPYATLSASDLENLALRTYLHNEIRLKALDELISRDEVSEAIFNAILKDDKSFLVIRDSWLESARKRLFDRKVSSNFASCWIALIPKVKKELSAQVNLTTAAIARSNQQADEIIATQINRENFDLDYAELFLCRYKDTPEGLELAESLASGTNHQMKEYISKLIDAGAEENVIRYVENKFTLCALRYLSKLPDARERKKYVSRIRELAKTEGWLGLEATNCLFEVFEDKDIEFLVEQLTHLGDESATHIVARATLKRLRGLIECENEDIVIAALHELHRRKRLPSHAKLMSFLGNKDSRIRMAALEIISATFDKDELVELLDKYLEGSDTYYYNIVCELDRRIAQIPKIL